MGAGTVLRIWAVFCLTVAANAAAWAQATDIDFSLANAGKITGLVRANMGGAPLPGLTVYAVDSASGGGLAVATTQSDGTYTLNGLRTGSYKVAVKTRVNTAYETYAGEYSQNAYTTNAATLVNVTAGLTTPNIDIALAVGGAISGFVTRDSDGAPLSALRVHAYGDAAESLLSLGGERFATTQSDGSYAIRGLPPGNYRVEVFADNGEYAGEYYDNTYSEGAASTVAVTLGATTSNVNFGLAVGGRIEGTVTRESDGSALFFAVVTATDDTAAPGESVVEYGAFTAVDGSYAITGLPPGDYRVQAETRFTPSAADLATEYYDGAYAPGSATPVSVTLGNTTSAINFDLALGGVINGVVKREGDAQPLADVSVYAYDLTADEFLLFDTASRVDGSYQFTGLPPGSYTVEANAYSSSGANVYAAEFYDDTYDAGAATELAINVGQTFNNIDFDLAVGGRISGAVARDVDGMPIADTTVYAFETNITEADFDASEFFVGVATTASDGSYAIIGLPPGNYIVGTSDIGGEYLNEFFDDTFDYASATPVTVTLGEFFGAIAGVVTQDSDGLPVAGVQVVARNYATDTVAGSALTQANGAYTITGLSPGSYRVDVDTTGTDYRAEYFDNTLDPNAATEVSVEVGLTTDSINFGLTTASADAFSGLLPRLMLLLLD